jgi:hypothetical protein
VLRKRHPATALAVQHPWNETARHDAPAEAGENVMHEFLGTTRPWGRERVPPTRVMTDRAAEDRKTVERVSTKARRRNVETTLAKKHALEGIDLVNRRFRRRRIHFFDDALAQRGQMVRGGKETDLPDRRDRRLYLAWGANAALTGRSRRRTMSWT